MFNLLVRGWRNINHSIALVNQYHLLAFTQRTDLQIFHEDMPFASSDWNPVTNSAGFGEAQQARINAVPSPASENFDAILSIAVPILPSTRRCHRQATFVVTEFGFRDSDFDVGGRPASWYTEGNRTIVTPSNWCKQKLESFGLDPTRIEVIPHGVDKHLFFPITEEEREMSRRQLGFKEDEFVFLNLGGMMANKGVDLVLTAFAIVLQKYPKARLLLKDMRQLYQYSTDHLFALINQNYPGLLTETVVSAIRVVGVNLPLNLMRAVYGAADVYVSPYRAEGFNLPVIEAMACGLPTLVTRGGATDDFCSPQSSRFIESKLSWNPINGQKAPGEYLEPALQSLVGLMEAEIRTFRKSYEQRRTLAASVPIENDWGRVADRYLEHLGKISLSGVSSFAFERLATGQPPIFYCFCEGGLGNRLNSLYMSMALAKGLGRKLKVFWPINTWCEASFESLFGCPGLDVEAVEMIDCADLISRSKRIVWEDHLKLGIDFRTPESFGSFDEFLATNRTNQESIFYCSPLIPPWVATDKIDEVVLTVKPHPELTKKAREYSEVAFAGRPYVGLHIRKTDYGALVDENLSFKVIHDHPQVLFFVCSDSAETETTALKIPNVRVRLKSSYVEKRVNGGWNAPIVDESGRGYSFNVRRSAHSVEEAVVDLLILARSQILRNSTSTFLSLAEIWSRVGI
jgi:glycosyltransferase involved in cell wall biosynthesis